MRPWVEELRDGVGLGVDHDSLASLSGLIRSTLGQWLQLPSPTSTIKSHKPPTVQPPSRSGGVIPIKKKLTVRRERESSPEYLPTKAKSPRSTAGGGFAQPPPQQQPQHHQPPQHQQQPQRSTPGFHVGSPKSNSMNTGVFQVVEVLCAEEASKTGHLDWVRQKLLGEGGKNLFHIKKQSGATVMLKKSNLTNGSASLQFTIKAQDRKSMDEGLSLINDLIQTVSRSYRQHVDVRRQ